MSILFHYEVLNEFKRQFYKDVLGFEHLIAGEIKIDKVSFPDGGRDEEFNFWGYQLEKNGLKYLLPSKDQNNLEIRLIDLLPIIPRDTQKVAYRGQVYHYIRRPVSVRFKPEKKLTFKEFIEVLNNFEHTNKDERKLLVFMGSASLLDRANFRICSPAGFGKDSVVDTLGNLIGGCFTIENPTIAKLEYMTYSKWLAVNEIVDIQKTEWRNIEQFLLSAGAHKTEITKHSRATSNGVKEILDISKFSLSLMYNDIDHYPETDKYVDFVTKKAVLDRFPAFRLSGVLQEDFNVVKTIDIKKFVEEHFNDYKDLIYTYTYFKENLNKELKRFNADKLRKDIPHRWKLNIGSLLKIVDLYCDNQEEFDYWITKINYSLTDYEIMLEYPKILSKVSKRLSESDSKDLFIKIRGIPTFTDKKKVLLEYIPDKKKGKEVFWESK